ncbi:MAG: rRNA maturation RNase YbeY [Clostridia bacterium]|nr:rRNA maturation RNase YbeY [Clostridia bacterium]
MSGLLAFEWEAEALPGAEEMLLRVAACCVRAEGIALPCYAQLRVTDNEEIRKINREYRDVDRATDVLSFPSVNADPGRTLGKRQDRLKREMDETGRCFLGDIVISLERAREQAEEYGHSLNRELAYLTAHALFHLMGYDHMNEKDKERMRDMEEKRFGTPGSAG